MRLRPGRPGLSPALVMAVLALGWSVHSAAQVQQVFSTRVEMVRVDVLVTERGQPVVGLQPSNFEVLDNGVPQEVELVSFDQIPLNVVFVLDMSRSVTGVRLDQLRSAARTALAGLKRDDQAALVTFSHVVTLGSALTTKLDDVRAALDRSVAEGDSALVDAVHAGMTMGEADVGRALLLVFSDGFDTASWLTSEAVLDAARRSEVVAYTVAVGVANRPPFLRDLSRLTGGTLLQIESTKDLAAAFVGILNEFRQRYLVSYSPRGVAKEGWHRIEVRVDRKGAAVKARAGYMGELKN